MPDALWRSVDVRFHSRTRHIDLECYKHDDNTVWFEMSQFFYEVASNRESRLDVAKEWKRSRVHFDTICVAMDLDPDMFLERSFRAERTRLDRESGGEVSRRVLDVFQISTRGVLLLLGTWCRHKKYEVDRSSTLRVLLAFIEAPGHPC